MWRHEPAIYRNSYIRRHGRHWLTQHHVLLCVRHHSIMTRWIPINHAVVLIRFWWQLVLLLLSLQLDRFGWHYVVHWDVAQILALFLLFLELLEILTSAAADPAEGSTERDIPSCWESSHKHYWEDQEYSYGYCNVQYKVYLVDIWGGIVLRGVVGWHIHCPQIIVTVIVVSRTDHHKSSWAVAWWRGWWGPWVRWRWRTTSSSPTATASTSSSLALYLSCKESQKNDY